MTKTICVANQKGGVGKTTTAVNLSASLAAAEYRTLLVDCDSQANATSGVGLTPAEVKVGLYDLLVDRAKPIEAIAKTYQEKLDILPSSIDLIGVEVEFVDLENRYGQLRKALAKAGQDYDYVVIDCPPSLGMLTINSLVAADSVLVPLQCEYYALEGLTKIISTINRIRTELNPALELEGVVLTMYDSRNNLSRQVVDEVRTHFGEKALATIIPRNVRLSESPSFGQPVLLYDIKSTGAQSYLALAQELIGNHGGAS